MITAISSLAGSYLQSILGSTLGSAAPTNGTAKSKAAGTQPDNGQLSPLGQVLNTLQQLQQTNPAQYQQVTQQIASNLQQAAQTAQADGNTGAATRLNQLAADFTKASQNGQLPSIQDLAQAAGQHHHHVHHAHAASSDPSSGASSTSNPTTDASGQSMSQLLAAFQSNAADSDAANPMSIILNTLASAGIAKSNP